MMTPQMNQSVYEDALIYEAGQKRMECVFSHVPGENPSMVLAAFPLDVEGEEIPDPLFLREMSMVEACMRYEFFNRLSNAGLLKSA